jgi:hypothetical protein
MPMSISEFSASTAAHVPVNPANGLPRHPKEAPPP